jgi:hypothetical protein
MIDCAQAPAATTPQVGTECSVSWEGAGVRGWGPGVFGAVHVLGWWPEAEVTPTAGDLNVQCACAVLTFEAFTDVLES